MDLLFAFNFVSNKYRFFKKKKVHSFGLSYKPLTTAEQKAWYFAQSTSQKEPENKRTTVRQEEGRSLTQVTLS